MENETYNDNTTFEASILLNRSNEVDPKLMERYLTNKGIDEPAYTTLIIMYCFLIVLGALGNTLVVCKLEIFYYAYLLHTLLNKGCSDLWLPFGVAIKGSNYLDPMIIIPLKYRVILF